ncbi:hypothetical protein [Fulvivirga ligni]|uniref:hypothetical protein n=1 Tax=Fulvivirga ligni TaxID=2904246 RepID=UPI001F4193D5|nr:hypothetical protein [Fulvivirga ligni]UII21287.1 hypothetical protein LVD16_25995 [Fulvivirga ligni]
MKKYLSVIMMVSLMWACQEEETQSIKTEDQSQTGQRVISEITVADNTLQFISNGDDIAVLEKFKPGGEPLLNEEVEGLTFAEIHRKLAPGASIPTEILEMEDKFELKMEEDDEAIQQELAEQGDYFSDLQGEPTVKQEGLNDVWFFNNYCNFPSFYNGYKACLLNRYGPGYNYAWADCTRSRVYVYPFQGTQIRLQGLADGKELFSVDLPVGYVYNYYIYSGRSIFGCRVNKRHYYYIYDYSGSGWHWSFRSNTDC